MEDIQQYFEQMQEDRKAKALVVHDLVLALYPECTVSMKYKMPTYESTEGWFSIGNQKNYWSVYTCSMDKIDGYLSRNPDTKHGKGCLNFRKRDEVDLEGMKQVIQHAMDGK